MPSRECGTIPHTETSPYLALEQEVNVEVEEAVVGDPELGGVVRVSALKVPWVVWEV